MSTLTKIPNPIDTASFFKAAAIAVMTFAVYEVAVASTGNGIDPQPSPAIIQRDSTSLLAEKGETVLEIFGYESKLPLKWFNLAENCGLSKVDFNKALALASAALTSWGGSFGGPKVGTFFDEDDELETLVIEFPVSAEIETAVDLSIDIGMFLFERLQLPHNVVVRCESIV